MFMENDTENIENLNHQIHLYKPSFEKFNRALMEKDCLSFYSLQFKEEKKIVAYSLFE